MSDSLWYFEEDDLPRFPEFTEGDYQSHSLSVTEDEYEQLYTDILNQVPYNFFVTLQSPLPEESDTPSSAIRSDDPIDRRLFELGVERTEPQQYYRWTDNPGYRNFDNLNEIPYRTTVKVLGEGKFGEVSVVSHIFSDVPLARKEFITTTESLLDAEEKFVQEAQVMSKMTFQAGVKHRVTVADYFSVRNKRYFLLTRPVASDGNLNRFLKDFRDGCYKTEPVLKKAIGCLTASLAAIHEQGILHRDIHGGNILFHENTVLYADFGSSTLSETQGLDSDYTAPELQTSNSYTEKVDAFALAEVLNRIWSHLVTVPHGHPSPSSAEEQLVTGLISRLRQHDPEDRLTVKKAAIDIFITTNADARFMCASCREWCYERVDYSGVLWRKMSLPFTIPNYILDSEDSRLS